MCGPSVEWRPWTGLGFALVRIGGRGWVPADGSLSTPAEGRAGRRETSSATAGTRAGGDRAGLARGTEGVASPVPLGPRCPQRGSGFASGSDVSGRRCERVVLSGCRAVLEPVGTRPQSPLLRGGGVGASGTRPAAGPLCTQQGRRWPSRQSSAVRALRQSAQCPGRGVCCGAVSASGHSQGDDEDSAPAPPVTAARRAECL